MKARIAATTLVAAGLVLGMSGCGMITPVATEIKYDPSAGVSVTLGDVALRNILIITDTDAAGDNDGSLVMTAINTGSSDAVVTVQYLSNSVRQTQTFDVAAGQSIAFGTQDTSPLQLPAINTPAGAMLSVYFQSGTADGHEILVPVLNQSISSYRTLGPTASPSPSAIPTSPASPTPTSTP